jgi:hypothetical protein
MTVMTPQRLARKIKKCRVTQPITASYERALEREGIWSAEGVWYRSQKEHWSGWLSEYNGPGAYNRKTRRGRSAEFVYNHINCPPMLLWLAEAAGVPKTNVLAAKRSALAARQTRGTHCAVIRKFIPWQAIEEKLRTSLG